MSNHVHKDDVDDVAWSFNGRSLLSPAFQLSSGSSSLLWCQLGISDNLDVIHLFLFVCLAHFVHVVRFIRLIHFEHCFDAVLHHSWRHLHFAREFFCSSLPIWLKISSDETFSICTLPSPLSTPLLPLFRFLFVFFKNLPVFWVF